VAGSIFLAVAPQRYISPSTQAVSAQPEPGVETVTPNAIFANRQNVRIAIKFFTVLSSSHFIGQNAQRSTIVSTGNKRT